MILYIIEFMFRYPAFKFTIKKIVLEMEKRIMKKTMQKSENAISHTLVV